MRQPFYHANPNQLELETTIVDSRPGRVVLEQSPFFLGGGGQLPDLGKLVHRGGEVEVSGFEHDQERVWHILADPALELADDVRAEVDPEFRRMMQILHTGSHVLNALVFQEFEGALVTGAQLAADGSVRLDFDLPEVDNDRLRAMELQIASVIKKNLPVRARYVTLADAEQTPGLIRSKSATPPPSDDGFIRIVEIEGLDEQACGGTHLESTGQSPALRILKIDNKGRHNRRVRLGIAS
ncbi:alanyl-tRNA editing protein [Agrobacterium tumefaciens]|uniref:alanyl-tRNA editing protein n=1 Tax=Agrobacterium tumefaciens TaxID=358 RepID=UPI003CE59DA6